MCGEAFIEERRDGVDERKEGCEGCVIREFIEERGGGVDEREEGCERRQRE